MVIVIVDSGVAERYADSSTIVFPMVESNSVPPVISGHGTAVFNIINSHCSQYSKIINFRILNIENGIEEAVLIDALSYINDHINPDIINLSMGITECSNVQGLFDVCRQLEANGTVVVSAFDNSGSISYPAAFENVIGVTTGKLCHKTDDFEFFDDPIVNIGAKGGMQRLAWSSPHTIFLSGNSFACAHVTSKIAEIMHNSEKPTTKEQILDRFKQIAVNHHNSLSQVKKTTIPFAIKRAAVFPFSKEIQGILRFEKTLDFTIVGVYDTKYSARIGSTTRHLMNDENLCNHVIQNVEKLDYNFDTFILGHMQEISSVLGDDFVVHLVEDLLDKGKQVFSLDDPTYYGIRSHESLAYPSITSDDVPPNRLGMLYRISTPVLGILGTSSKQGKFTLQLRLRDILTKKGYKIGGIGTEPTASLYGLEYTFPMGYNSTVEFDGNREIISYLNWAMHDLETQTKDLIIVGSQSGTIPYDFGNIGQFPVYQCGFLWGTLPDIVVLCINLFDSYSYIHRTIAFIESIAMNKVIALAALPIGIRKSSVMQNDVINLSSAVENFDEMKTMFRFEFGVPLFNLTSNDDIERLAQLVIDSLQ